MTDSSLGLPQVAAELGVHYMTAYRYVRLGILPAVKVGRVWQVEADALALFVQQRADRAIEGGDKSSDIEWSRRYEARTIAGDSQGSWLVIEASRVSGMTATDVYLKVIKPALERIGERWADGEIDVFQEHRATVISRGHLGRLAPNFGHRGQSRGAVLLGCAPGEHHDIGLLMMGDLLRQAGFESIVLGSDVPLASFEAAATETSGLIAVGVSIHHPELLDVAVGVIDLLRVATPAAKLMVGGRGSAGISASQIGADYIAADAAQTVRWLVEHAEAPTCGA